MTKSEENIVAKEEITRFEQFLLLSLPFSKSCLLQRRQKASICRKGLKLKVKDDDDRQRVIL